MRITKVSVKKLFGIFDHEIPLNQESRITIIHGPNGVGKTTLLRMVDGLFRLRWDILATTVFEKLSVHFFDGTYLVVEKDLHLRQMALPDILEDLSERRVADYSSGITVWHSQNARTFTEPFVPKFSDIQLSSFYSMINGIPELKPINDTEWRHADSELKLTLGDIIEALDAGWYLYNHDEPKWLQHITSQINAQYVEEQRLHVMSPLSVPDDYIFGGSTHVAAHAVVARNAEILAKIMRSSIATYGEQSFQLDRDLPNRLKRSNGEQRYDRTDLVRKFRELEYKTSRLMELGLVGHSEAPDISNIDLGNNPMTDMLSFYVGDIEEKLQAFDTIAGQLHALSELINERFEHKILKISKEEGFAIVTARDRKLLLERLSSGEQNLLVLYFQLIFLTQPDSLVMIDEPEISLHVDWQEQFLNDIKRVSDLRQLDVLVATHSPDIIGDRQDWMVGLGNPEMA